MNVPTAVLKKKQWGHKEIPGEREYKCSQKKQQEKTAGKKGGKSYPTTYTTRPAPQKKKKTQEARLGPLTCAHRFGRSTAEPTPRGYEKTSPRDDSVPSPGDTTKTREGNETPPKMLETSSRGYMCLLLLL